MVKYDSHKTHKSTPRRMAVKTHNTHTLFLLQTPSSPLPQIPWSQKSKCFKTKLLKDLKASGPGAGLCANRTPASTLRDDVRVSSGSPAFSLTPALSLDESLGASVIHKLCFGLRPPRRSSDNSYPAKTSWRRPKWSHHRNAENSV